MSKNKLKSNLLWDLVFDAVIVRHGMVVLIGVAEIRPKDGKIITGIKNLVGKELVDSVSVNDTEIVVILHGDTNPFAVRDVLRRKLHPQFPATATILVTGKPGSYHAILKLDTNLTSKQMERVPLDLGLETVGVVSVAVDPERVDTIIVTVLARSRRSREAVYIIAAQYALGNGIKVVG